MLDQDMVKVLLVDRLPARIRDKIFYSNKNWSRI